MDKKTICSSEAQTGGITANTVNIGSSNTIVKKRWLKLVLGVPISAVAALGIGYISTKTHGKIMSDNTTIISSNQSGGITAHTVNIGNQPRHLTQSLKQELAHLPRTANVVVTAVMGDQEAFVFGTEINSFLKEEGYNVQGVNQAVFTQPVVGQHIIKNSENEYQIVIGGNN